MEKPLPQLEVSAVVTPPPAINPLRVNLGEEIYDIFCEEVGEICETLLTAFPIWNVSRKNNEVLTDIRRAFHTLKGSGRMAGAFALGDFGWAHENLLNNVMSGRLSADDRVVSQIERAMHEINVRKDYFLHAEQGDERVRAFVKAADAIMNQQPDVDLSAFSVSAPIPDTVTVPFFESKAPESVNVPVQAAALSSNEDDAWLSADFDESADAAPPVTLVETPVSVANENMVYDEELLDFGSFEPISVNTLPPVVAHPEAAIQQNEYTNPYSDLAEIAFGGTAFGIPTAAKINAVQTSVVAQPEFAVIDEGAIVPEVLDGTPIHDAMLLEQPEALIEFDIEAASVVTESVIAATDTAISLNSIDADGVTAETPSIHHVIEPVTLDVVGADDAEWVTFDTPDTLPVNSIIEPTKASVPSSDWLVEFDEIHDAKDEIHQVDAEVSNPTVALLSDTPIIDEQGTALDIEAVLQPDILPVIDADVTSTVDVDDLIIEPVAEPSVSAPVLDAESRLIWQLFWEELPEQLQALDENLQTLRSDPTDRDVIRELEREFHTLKGGARMAQLFSIADVSHEAESLLAKLPHSTEPALDLVDTLQATVDRLHSLAEQCQRAGISESAAPVIQPKIRDVVPIETAPVPLDTVQPENTQDIPTAANSIWQTAGKTGSLLEQLLAEQAANLPDWSVLDSSSVAAVLPKKQVETEQQPQPENQETIRVSAAFVDKLIEQVVGLNVQQIRLSEQLGRMGIDVEELASTVTRLRQQVRLLELESEAQIHAGTTGIMRAKSTTDGFDPLEMDQYAEIQRISRSLAESLNDLVNLEADLSSQLTKGEQLIQSDMRMLRQIQQDLLDTRLVAVTVLIPRLRRLTRQTSTELGKQVALEVEGEDCELDRNLLQKMTGALEHLMRNAISHGIETPEEREKAGKPRTGKIILSFSRDEAEIVIRFKDNGRGLNPAKLRQRALEMGLMPNNQELSESELNRLILLSGFSTADSLSQISGRGIGMDVVYSEVKALGGSLQIESTFGKGVEFIMRLPFTLVVNPVLQVDVQDQVFALPMSGVQGVTRMSGSELQTALSAEETNIAFAGQKYRLRHLGRYLANGDLPAYASDEMLPIVLFEANKQPLAWAVDKIRGQREVVLQPLGVLFKGCRLYSAATVTPDGNVYLVPDMTELARQVSENVRALAPTAASNSVSDATRILVVDDSITVRRVTEKFLATQHYTVATAKDGMDALEQVGDFLPDAVLLDIEMPRMDGFELLGHLRRDPKWQKLPIIMISSRTAPKHREHAKELGATAFLGKPYQNEILLSTLQQVLKKTTHLLEEAALS